MCVGSPAQVHGEGFTCASRGSRACSEVRVRAARHDRHRCAQNADHLAHNSPLSPVFAEVVCTVGTTPPHVGTSPPPNGGNGVIRTATRRRHAVSQRLMLHNPHRHRYGRRRAADKTWAQRSVSAKKPTQHGASRGPPRNSSPSTAPPATLPRKNSPSKPKNTEIGVF